MYVETMKFSPGDEVSPAMPPERFAQEFRSMGEDVEAEAGVGVGVDPSVWEGADGIGDEPLRLFDQPGAGGVERKGVGSGKRKRVHERCLYWCVRRTI